MKKIKSIKISKDIVYDLTVKNNHNFICNGTILHNCDYRGNIGIILINHGSEGFIVRHGDRIAQMVIAPVTQAVFTEVEELSNTERGEGGYGSTHK